MKMNFVRIVLLSVLAAFCLCGIAGAQDTENGAIIDLSGSERYTEEELQAAVDIILAEFNTFEGCELHGISYAGDEESMDSLASTNSLERGVFDEIALFDSHFRSHLEQFGAWNPNEEYTWSWTLGRAEKGEWALVNFGWKENWFKSEQYSFDDLIAGMDAVFNSLGEMEGTSFRYMKYAGDEFSNSELEYINSLDRGSFDECAVYYVWFMSPREAYGAWEPYTLYSWSFYLGRADKGQWQVVTFGN